MVIYEPTELPPNTPSALQDVTGKPWLALYEHACAFDRTVFFQVMGNLIRNPNVNSSFLFRADILLETDGPEQSTDSVETSESQQPRMVNFAGYDVQKVLIRKLIPRNPQRDAPMDQTCIEYTCSNPDELQKSVVVYKPHVQTPEQMPFYHPQVEALAFLHERDPTKEQGKISIHYLFFSGITQEPKLFRTAYHLLSTLHKHGAGTMAGYVKRVHHDTIVSQPTVQNRYANLKEKYAKRLIETWAEVTDPDKHVFEDLAIAAFLIELWAQIYETSHFPGFVDIGCGNGLLVYILRQEGFSGWGFDARTRKSWDAYQEEGKEGEVVAGQPVLQQRVLLPSMISGSEKEADDILHNGRFPKNTFIISNHADELTPWTPILAATSECPFIMIPCCSHALSGARFRAPPPKGQNKASAYASLVDWVSQIGTECGWKIEKEMLRIPSTRNTGLVGRTRIARETAIDLEALIAKYGGAAGYLENVMQLVGAAPRGH